jgi:hypothetical protein
VEQAAAAADVILMLVDPKAIHFNAKELQILESVYEVSPCLCAWNVCKLTDDSRRNQRERERDGEIERDRERFPLLGRVVSGTLTPAPGLRVQNHRDKLRPFCFLPPELLAQRKAAAPLLVAARSRIEQARPDPREH